MDAQKHILIVDDEETIRRVLSRIMRGAGLSVSTARDPKDAIIEAQKKRPDLVLLDVNMPNGGGLRFLELAKRFFPTVPVIMVTGMIDENEAKRTMELGAVDYITKPIDPSYLNITVQANLAARGF